MTKTIRRIEINFPQGVELTSEVQQQLDRIAGQLCKAWQAKHPGRVMWPAGIGSKIAYMPLTADDERERGLEFDPDTFEIECAEREDYDWPCAKCGTPQGGHKTCITEPPAGDCDYEPGLAPIRTDDRKGGPTVDDPDRPYCKPDQSCCDFCCGN